jgi:hypothetical protein
MPRSWHYEAKRSNAYLYDRFVCLDLLTCEYMNSSTALETCIYRSFLEHKQKLKRLKCDKPRLEAVSGVLLEACLCEINTSHPHIITLE